MSVRKWRVCGYLERLVELIIPTIHSKNLPPMRRENCIRFFWLIFVVWMNNYGNITILHKSKMYPLAFLEIGGNYHSMIFIRTDKTVVIKSCISKQRNSKFKSYKNTERSLSLKYDISHSRNFGPITPMYYQRWIFGKAFKKEEFL